MLIYRRLNYEYLLGYIYIYIYIYITDVYNYLLKCSFVAPTVAVMYLFLSLRNVTSSIVWEVGGGVR
jgi:hypothetical protein